MFSIVIDRHTSKKAFTLEDAIKYANENKRSFLKIYKTENEQLQYFNIQLVNNKEIVSKEDIQKVGIKEHDIKNYYIFFIIKNNSKGRYENIYNLRNITFNKCMCLNKDRYVLIFLPKLSNSYYFYWLTYIKTIGLNDINIYLLTNTDYLNGYFSLNPPHNYSLIFKNIDGISENHNVEIPIYNVNEIEQLIKDSEPKQIKSSIELFYKNKPVFILNKEKRYKEEFKDYDYVIYFDSFNTINKLNIIFNNLDYYKIDYFKFKNERYIYIALKSIDIIKIIDICSLISSNIYLPLGIKLFTIYKEIQTVNNKSINIQDDDFIIYIKNEDSEDSNLEQLKHLNKSIKQLGLEYFQIAIEYRIIIGVKREDLNLILNELSTNLNEYDDLIYKQVSEIDKEQLNLYLKIYNNQTKLIQTTI